MIDTLVYYFEFPFVRYALIVGVLIALCSSLLGVTLVLKRFSFIGDGLSHVAFGAIAIASVLNLSNDMFFVLPATVICAVLLLRTGQNTKIKGDAAVAMISVGALAVGYLLMNIFSTSANLSGDVCSTLFGSTSILTLSISEVWLCVVLSIAVVVIFVVFYNKIFAVTFDEDFAQQDFRGHLRRGLRESSRDKCQYLQPPHRRDHRNYNRACDESGRLSPDFRAGHFPGTVGNARVQELQDRDDLFGGRVGHLRDAGNTYLDPSGNAGRINDCGHRYPCFLCRMRCGQSALWSMSAAF